MTESGQWHQKSSIHPVKTIITMKYTNLKAYTDLIRTIRCIRLIRVPFLRFDNPQPDVLSHK
jgi:hypothetical protein